MQSIHIMMVIILTIMIGWCPEGRAENKSPKINVQDIIKPDGSLDLKKIGQINISGSLNASDYLFVIDRDTKEPIFLPGTSASHPDDVYWDNTASPCLGGIDGTVNAMMVFDSKLYIGGYFEIAGCAFADNIACWNGETWESLGDGLASDSINQIYGCAFQKCHPPCPTCTYLSHIISYIPCYFFSYAHFYQR